MIQGWDVTPGGLGADVAGAGQPLRARVFVFVSMCFSFIYIFEKERDGQVDASGCWWRWEVSFRGIRLEVGKLSK